MNKKGSIIIESTLVMTIIILIVFLGFKELMHVEVIIEEYFNSQDETYQESIRKNIEELRIEKALLDGK